MSSGQLRITTDEGRRRFLTARERGGLCAGCGRALGPDEPVYIEAVEVERKPLTAPGAYWRRRIVSRDAPLGAECATPAFLAAMRERPPAECVCCGRPVYYAMERARRRQVSCSSRCSSGHARRRG